MKGVSLFALFEEKVVHKYHLNDLEILLKHMCMNVQSWCISCVDGTWREMFECNCFSSHYKTWRLIFDFIWSGYIRCKENFWNNPTQSMAVLGPLSTILDFWGSHRRNDWIKNTTLVSFLMQILILCVKTETIFFQTFKIYRFCSFNAEHSFYEKSTRRR